MVGGEKIILKYLDGSESFRILSGEWVYEDGTTVILNYNSYKERTFKVHYPFYYWLLGMKPKLVETLKIYI